MNTRNSLKRARVLLRPEPPPPAMGSIVSCATRNEVKQQTYEQRRMHAAYAEYFSKLEQGLKGELPFQVVVRLLTDDDEAVAASEEESERQERELEGALQCALLVLLLTLDALHRMSDQCPPTPRGLASSPRWAIAMWQRQRLTLASRAGVSAGWPSSVPTRLH